MNAISDKDLATFFKDAPLYSKVQLLDTLDEGKEFELFKFFEDKAYKFHCPYENDIHTFKISKTWGSVVTLVKGYASNLADKSERISVSFHLKGICQSCKFPMDFLLNMFTEESVNNTASRFPPILIKKIGQLPPFELVPEKEVLDYLSTEDKSNYKKALLNLSVSFGIGAFAYFRRIIENEIKRLVKDISELDFEDSGKIRQAMRDYDVNHQMSTLIDHINSFLPKSLKELGDNPIRLLHQQLSGGIHEFTEEECLEKAKVIDTLLRYVIRKVNSEKFELLEVKKAIKALRS